MKRYLTILLATSLAALTGQALQAGPVSEETAKGIAGRILSAHNNRKGGADVKLVWTGEDPGDQPAMYVYTSGSGGFVIISGDDNTVPVLAISENGQFEADDMPEHVRWWMRRMEAHVRATQTPAEGVKKQWARVAAMRADGDLLVDNTQVVDKVGHLTPEWDQGNMDLTLFGKNIFNKYCPMDGETLSVAGCVPVSVAEVLTTLSGLYPDVMPATSTGSISEYDAGGRLAAATKGHPYQLGTIQNYDWAGLRTLTDVTAIQTALTDVSKTELLDQLSRLMADCGAIIQAMYSAEGTGAYSVYIPERFAQHFYTSKRARMEKADSYTPAQWIRMLKTELAKHPVLYSGRTTIGNYGHAFVFDGYGRFNGQDVFHVNFGWRSLYNGYYYYNYLYTGENGETHQDEIWGNDCDAIFDFFPDKNGTTVEVPYLRLSSNGTNPGLTASTTTFTPNMPFTLNVGTVKNTGSENYVTITHNNYNNGQFIYAYLRKKDGTTLHELGRSDVSIYNTDIYYYSGPVSDSWSGDISCEIPSEAAPAFGDCIALYYTVGTNAKEPVSFDGDGDVIGEIPITPTAFIQKKSAYQIGDIFPFRIANYGAKYAGTEWFITYPDGTRVKKPQSYDSFQFTQSGKYKIEAAIAATVKGPVIERLVTIVNVSQ